MKVNNVTLTEIISAVLSDYLSILIAIFVEKSMQIVGNLIIL